MSHTWPASLPKTMPSPIVVDYSGRLSPAELSALDSYGARTHYCAHVVILAPTVRPDSTSDFALHMAQTWKLEPQGFLLVVNTHNDSAAMVAGASLQSKGISSKFVNETLMPMRFEKEYIQGNLAGAVRSTLSGVEHRLNVTAVQADRPAGTYHTRHQGGGGGAIFFVVICIFFFFALIISRLSSASANPRRMRLGGNSGSSDLASDLERINLALDHAPSVQQVPMKEFVQRAGLGRSTQNSLDALSPSAIPFDSAHQMPAQIGNYGTQMMAQDAIGEQKIFTAEARAKNTKSADHTPLKLIFEGAHGAPSEQPVPEIVTTAAEQSFEAQGVYARTNGTTAEQPNAFEMPVYKPYDFPEAETVVPDVSSLEPSTPTSVADSAPNLDINAPQAIPVAAAAAADSLQTTESVLRVDQYAQAMTSEPDLSAELPLWQPASYTLPPTPVLPVAPALPVSQFAASMNSDFTDVLNRSSSNYASVQQSGFMTQTASNSDSAGGKEARAPGVCPKCQSEKSPDFSFCLRCGHMFV